MKQEVVVGGEPDYYLYFYSCSIKALEGQAYYLLKVTHKKQKINKSI